MVSSYEGRPDGFTPSFPEEEATSMSPADVSGLFGFDFIEYGWGIYFPPETFISIVTPDLVEATRVNCYGRYVSGEPKGEPKSFRYEYVMRYFDSESGESLEFQAEDYMDSFIKDDKSGQRYVFFYNRGHETPIVFRWSKDIEQEQQSRDNFRQFVGLG